MGSATGGRAGLAAVWMTGADVLTAGRTGSAGWAEASAAAGGMEGTATGAPISTGGVQQGVQQDRLC